VVLVKLGRADAKRSAGELLHANLEAYGLHIALEEKRVKFAVCQESHVSAGDVKLMKDVSGLATFKQKKIRHREDAAMSFDAISNVSPDK
jgi:hypothetical protein